MSDNISKTALCSEPDEPMPPPLTPIFNDGQDIVRVSVHSQHFRIVWTQQLTPAEWAEFTPMLGECEFGELALRWCEMLAASKIPRLSISYFLIRDRQFPAGIGVFYLVRNLDAARYLKPPWNVPFELLRRLGLNPLRFDVGFLDVPFVRASGLLVPPTASPDAQALLAREITQLIKKQFMPHVVLASLPANEGIRKRFLADAQFVRSSFAPNAELDLPFENFDDYLASLRKKVRWDVKDKMRRFENAGGTLERTSQTDQYASEFYELWQSTCRAHEGNDPVWPIDANRELFRNLGSLGSDNCSVLIARVGGKIAGYLVLVSSGGSLYYKFCGLDYKLSVPTMAYFNLLYGGIKVALELKCTRVIFGPTTYFNKERLGCKLVPYDWYVYVVRGVLRIGRKLISLE